MSGVSQLKKTHSHFHCKVETRSVNDSMGDALGEENSGTENGETKNNFGTKNREKKTNLDDKILQTMDGECHYFFVHM